MTTAANKPPVTHQRNLAKLPLALAPLMERRQWAVWRWTQRDNGSWQKPPFMATQPQRHASTKDPGTWADYAAALAAVQAGHADGISYILTEQDPFAAIDIDNCRHLVTRSIDVWAQNFLDVGRHSYSEMTPSGAGCRIWGLANGEKLHRKFDLVIDDKPIAAELFRRTNKALTVTGYTLDPAIQQLVNIDRALKWAVVWGERRKAGAMETAAPAASNGFNGGGCRYTVEQVDAFIRDGAPTGSDRSALFHTVVGHLSGCGWDAERIFNHVAHSPDGIGAKYIAEGRLETEIDRSLGKFRANELPLSGDGSWANGWDAETPPQPEPSPERGQSIPPAVNVRTSSPTAGNEVRTPNADGPVGQAEFEDDLDEELGDDKDLPPANPDLPPLHAHGDPDPRPLKAWLIKHLIPAVGHGLLSGQWGAGKTFAFFDLAGALITGQPWLGHTVKRKCGVLLIAAEGGDEVRLRLDAVVREKCGGLQRAPFRWYETAPLLLHKGSVEKLIAMAQQAEKSLQAEFGLPLGLIVIDTIAACAGYSRAGDEHDNAVGQAIMNVLKVVSQKLGCFVLGIDHFGKRLEAGTRAPRRARAIWCWRASGRSSSAGA
jgi:AAA domain